jgi:hypothetical protein
MTIRRPLVVIQGRTQELPLGDSIEFTSEEDTMYSKRIDFINDSTLYRGEAAVGSYENLEVWRIRKIAMSSIDGDITETWASGNALFNKIWVDRTTYTYR